MNERNFRPVAVGDALVAASRQVWLASLGAAAVTRDWAEREGTLAFRKLVREGTAVESRAFRKVGERIENSYTQANTLFMQARRTVATTVQTYADTANSLVRDSLPVSLPKVEITIDTEPMTVTRARKTARPAKAAKPARRASKAVKRTAKTSKRG